MKRAGFYSAVCAVLLAPFCMTPASVQADEKITDEQTIHDLLSDYIPELEAQAQEGWEPSVWWHFPPNAKLLPLDNKLARNRVVIGCTWYVADYVERAVNDYLEAHNADSSIVFYFVSESGEQPMRGDTDGDGTVSAEDAQQILRCYTNRIAGYPPSLLQAVIADVSKDGEVSVEDAQYTLRYYTENSVAGKSVTWQEILAK